MAIRSEMTWQPDRNRWRKLYRGVLYFVTCRELGTASTKEASYQEANVWWQRKRAELASIRPIHPFQDAIAELTRQRDWASRHGEQEERKVLSAKIKEVESLGERDDDPATMESATIMENIRIATEMFGIQLPSDLDPIAARQFFGDTKVWRERFRRDFITPIPVAETIGGHIERYLELERARHDGGTLSASQYKLTVLCLNKFGEWIGTANTPNIITADRWEAFWLHLVAELSTGKASVEYCKKRSRFAKTFISWLVSKNVILILSNLHERRYQFSRDRPIIKVFTADEARAIVDRADGQLKLHLLLMLNCGFSQQDISDLHPSEIHDGRIVRRRSKTGKKQNVPTVSYKLWPETWSLLQKYRSTDPDHVLLNRRGKPWLDRARVGGKPRRDGIETKYRYLNPPCSLKTFRATSSNLLDGSEHARFKSHFLGHAPSTIAEKHYTNRDNNHGFTELFDEAIEWLGGQYGF